MAEPFKENINLDVINGLATELSRVSPAFPSRAFIKQASAGLSDLELKARVQHVAQALVDHLPASPLNAYTVMVASLAEPKPDQITPDPAPPGQGVRGWAVWPLTQAVVLLGVDHFDEAMGALCEMTQRWSSEFAVRTFLIADTDRAMAHVMQWANSPKAHVRRLASEGIRPRLPWGQQLPMFIDDPGPILPVLEILKDDPSEYVRRSVANCLNDIGKDHPESLVQIAQNWMRDAPPARQKLIRHACRSLLKQGHADILALFGYTPDVAVTASTLTLSGHQLKLGEALGFEVTLANTGAEPVQLMIDYRIHHVRADGSRSPKVFKGGKMRLKAAEAAAFIRKHTFKPVTTRKYHAGTHVIDIQVNGRVAATAEFELSV